MKTTTRKIVGLALWTIMMLSAIGYIIVIYQFNMAPNGVAIYLPVMTVMICTTALMIINMRRVAIKDPGEL